MNDEAIKFGWFEHLGYFLWWNLSSIFPKPLLLSKNALLHAGPFVQCTEIVYVYVVFHVPTLQPVFFSIPEWRHSNSSYLCEQQHNPAGNKQLFFSVSCNLHCVFLFFLIGKKRISLNLELSDVWKMWFPNNWTLGCSWGGNPLLLRAALWRGGDLLRHPCIHLLLKLTYHYFNFNNRRVIPASTYWDVLEFFVQFISYLWPFDYHPEVYRF